MPVHDIEAVLKAEEDAVSRIRAAEAEAESSIAEAEEQAAHSITQEKKKAESASDEKIALVRTEAEAAARAMAEDTRRKVEQIRAAAASKQGEAVSAIIAAITGGDDVLSGRDA
jgi:vacuolar-type H+-ATPase subunit H